MKASRHLHCAASLLAATSLFAIAQAQDAPIVQPGAPGQDVRELSAEDAVKIADTSYTKDDVMFMQMMIPHHQQAVDMAVLVDDRTNNEDILDIAGRIKKSQADEIAFMKTWLEDRGEPVEMMHGDGMHMDHAAMGMASEEDMEELATLEGTEFDRKFLTLMIPHHEGAVRMVNDLLAKPGSAYDPVLYDFISDVVNDQKAEITRMNGVLSQLSTDPRVGLSAGFRDAGEAAMNVKLVASLPKPRGFFDPENPSNLPPVKEPEPSEEDDSRENEDGTDAKTEWGERWPLLSFWNTDMAFQDDILVAGNYHGFNIYKLGEDGVPTLVSSVVCPGGQGDVSIVGDLLIMSVEQTRGRVDCGLEGISEDVSKDRFRGLRIFDISDLEQPKQVGQVQTCRGSHTHSVVSADRRRIVVYNSGTAGARDEEELEGCVGYVPGDDRTAYFSIDVIEIPVRNPSRARITSSPRVFADDEGRIAGLWQGGDHGEGTQRTSETNQCHDITVFPSLELAAGACSGNGIILDISDPLNPKRIDDVSDEGFAYWHSATFNNDGTKVLFTDEWGGGTQPRCRASDPKNWGADAFYEINDGKLEFASYYKIDAPQSEQENCVAHNGSVVPVPGRDIFAQAWYQGGLSVIDFTDTKNPKEIAFFDRGPIHDERMVIGGYWSTYWYGGKIYGTEIIRGLDVLELTPSEFLTENEIAAAEMADMGGTFNPQQQFPVTWPDHPVVAMAYLDQLERDGGLAEAQHSDAVALMKLAKQAMENGTKDRELAAQIAGLAKELSPSSDDAVAEKRVAALSDTMEGIAKKLR
ncbi:DUF305 domain-containing protein [Parvularcula lutaonensis]|uniref:DUF305 domain-containing protein n=1 Tax=Parvularcula lutaonensis TaxID=491923 RepID=A0ABV7MFK2_9PROT|nr:DUF305 domain-containing protein [Parvularcula lutaonensis]GGY53733.1 hypothetical protein GCM10007148_23810 [Parvularcula lutaonensis]